MLKKILPKFFETEPEPLSPTLLKTQKVAQENKKKTSKSSTRQTGSNEGKDNVESDSYRKNKKIQNNQPLVEKGQEKNEKVKKDKQKQIDVISQYKTVKQFEDEFKDYEPLNDDDDEKDFDFLLNQLKNLNLSQIYPVDQQQQTQFPIPTPQTIPQMSPNPPLPSSRSSLSCPSSPPSEPEAEHQAVNPKFLILLKTHTQAQKAHQYLQSLNLSQQEIKSLLIGSYLHKILNESQPTLNFLTGILEKYQGSTRIPSQEKRIFMVFLKEIVGQMKLKEDKFCIERYKYKIEEDYVQELIALGNKIQTHFTQHKIQMISKLVKVYTNLPYIHIQAKKILYRNLTKILKQYKNFKKSISSTRVNKKSQPKSKFSQPLYPDLSSIPSPYQYPDPFTGPSHPYPLRSLKYKTYDTPENQNRNQQIAESQDINGDFYELCSEKEPKVTKSQAFWADERERDGQRHNGQKDLGKYQYYKRFQKGGQNQNYQFCSGSQRNYRYGYSSGFEARTGFDQTDKKDIRANHQKVFIPVQGHSHINMTKNNERKFYQKSSSFQSRSRSKSKQIVKKMGQMSSSLQKWKQRERLQKEQELKRQIENKKSNKHSVQTQTQLKQISKKFKINNQFSMPIYESNRIAYKFQLLQSQVSQNSPSSKQSVFTFKPVQAVFNKIAKFETPQALIALKPLQRHPNENETKANDQHSQISSNLQSQDSQSQKQQNKQLSQNYKQTKASNQNSRTQDSLEISLSFVHNANSQGQNKAIQSVNRVQHGENQDKDAKLYDISISSIERQAIYNENSKSLSLEITRNDQTLRDKIFNEQNAEKKQKVKQENQESEDQEESKSQENSQSRSSSDSDFQQSLQINNTQLLDMSRIVQAKFTKSKDNNPKIQQKQEKINQKKQQKIQTSAKKQQPVQLSSRNNPPPPSVSTIPKPSTSAPVVQLSSPLQPLLVYLNESLAPNIKNFTQMFSKYYNSQPAFHVQPRRNLLDFTYKLCETVKKVPPMPVSSSSPKQKYLSQIYQYLKPKTEQIQKLCTIYYKDYFPVGERRQLFQDLRFVIQKYGKIG